MFEQVISHPLAGRRLDPRILPAAVTLHAAIALVAVVANTWQIQEVSAPDFVEPYVLVSMPREEPAPVRREAAKPPAEKPQQQAVTQAQPEPPVQQPDPTQMTTPSTIPDDSSGTDLSDLAPVGDPGAGDGTEAGPSGPGGGKGDCVENCGPADGEGDIRYPSPGMTPPRVIERVTPQYPELAKRVRKTGRVMVKAVIDATGTVRDAQVISHPLGFGLEESALKAIYRWRFAPARLGERPLAVFFNLTVDFSLQ